MRTFCIAIAACSAIGLPGISAKSASAGALEGRNYAQDVCAECHAVLASDKISPKAGAPTFTAIAAKPVWTRTALLVWFQTPHEQMPNLILKPDDKEDLVDYILSLKDDSHTGSN